MAGRDLSSELFGSEGGGGRDFSADLFGANPAALQEKSGFLRQAADVPLSVGRGAVTGVRMIADAFGAGSGASEALKGAEGYLASLMSAQSKNDEKEVARILKDAEDKGMLDQVKAGFKAFSVAPVDLLSQGFGAAAPAVLGILGGKVLGAGALGMKAAGVGIGAGMGAGSIKGGIYEETKAALREAGIDEAKAEQAAIQAQEYGGKNLDQILLGAGLGAVGGRFGVESAARRIMTKAAGQQTAKGAVREVAEGAARTAATEAVPELLQGSQEQVAKNIALQREGFDVPTMRGVASSGTLEALAGAGLGTVAGGAEAGLRRQARGEADRIIAEEEKAAADAEQARLDAEAAEKAKGAQVITDQTAELQRQQQAQEAAMERARSGGIGGGNEVNQTMLDQARIRKEQQERAAAAEEKAAEAERTKGVRAERDRITSTQYSSDPMMNEVMRSRAVADFDAQQTNLEAKAAGVTVPEDDNYALLVQAKERLRQQGTPEAKKTMARIDERLNSIVLQDVERISKEAEVVKTAEAERKKEQDALVAEENQRQDTDRKKAEGSAFAQDVLPEPESRDVVFGNEALADLQAKDTPAEMSAFELARAKSVARKQPRPITDEDVIAAEQDKDLKGLLAKRNKIKTGGNLYRTLEGQLNASEVNDISPDIKKLYGKGFRPLVRPGGQGADISELVDDGLLNDFLPSEMRKGAENYDQQASAEYIKNKLRTKNTKAEVSTAETRELDEQISYLSNVIDEREKLAKNLASIDPDEIASVDRSATDQEVVDATDIRYQRSTATGPSIGVDRTLEVSDAAKKNWANAPQVVVAENMDDPVIPKAVREHNKEAITKGAKGKPKGFFYKGKAYILADGMSSDQDVIEALFHESLGHYGLRGTFGPEMGKVLADVVKNRRTEVETKAEQYGLDPKNPNDMLEAAEEVLAEIAQTKPGLSFVKRAISVIRNFLRDLGLPFKMSNEDIIQKYILPARAFVEKGERRPVEGKPAAMREPTKAPPTDSAAFKKFFGDSKVVDENGEPMVVYHGTPYDNQGLFKDMRSGRFNLGFHFGTQQAANDVLDSVRYDYLEGKHVLPVYLSIKNPIEFDIDADRGFHKPSDLYQMIMQKAEKEGVSGITEDDIDAFYQDTHTYKGRSFTENVNEPEHAQLVKDWITQKLGVDGFKYVNAAEDPGSISWIAFEPTQIKSAIGNIGTFDPENPDIRYQREAEAGPAKASPTRQNIFGEPVLGTWSITVDPKMELQDGLIYKMLDKNIDIKRIIEAVKKTGKEIATRWNPYLQEELYHGRTAEASKLFQDNEWLPLLQDMQKKDVTIGELEKYLLNRHAEDYNKFVAERNKTRPEMQDGGSSVKTEDARKYLAGLNKEINKETKAKYDELAKRIDGITKGTRKLLVDTGYEKAETIKAWEEMFPNYVPLMREEMDFDYNFGSFGTGRGFDVRRDFSRSAMGSKRNVKDIIGNVISARNNAIALTEKNRVAQAVYGLALDAPNPDFWMAINPDLAEVRQVQKVKENIAKLMAKRANPSLTDAEREGLKSSFDAEYKKLKFAQVKAQKAIEKVREELSDLGIPEESINAVMQEPEQRILDPKKNEVVKRVNPNLRNNDFVLATRINGERRYVFFNPKDPRSARAATALKNLDAQDLGTALGLVAKVTRWMASVNTQYNPIFGPYNFLRDIQAGALQLSTTELAGQQKEIAKLIVPSMGAIYSSLRKRRKGEVSKSKMTPDWKEFQEEGGQTGFRDNFSRTQDRTEALLDEMAKLSEGKLKAGGRAVFDWLSDYNDSLENAVRLSAYVVSREKFKKEGVNEVEAKQRAASLAKNLTVNFNRKGDVATQMGALYAFFNASMQGSARMVETLKGPMGKRIMGGGLLLGSMQAVLLAAAGFDDEEPPEFIRSKNIVIPTGDGDYFAFPMPLGYHVIPGISRILTEWSLSGFKDTARRVTDLTGLFLDAFNPIGNAGWSFQTLAPTAADPIVALFENRDFTGKPISKEDMFSLNPTPGYSRAREGANFLTTNLAEFLNAASGGDKDRKGVISPTPEQIEYLIGQATGGVGREAVKLTTTIDKTITGEELPPYKVPLYGRFFGETKSSAAESNKFYKNMKELNELNNVVTGRRERREPLGNFYQENPQARLLPLANKTFKDVQELRKRRKALLERDAPRESIQVVEKQITRKMQVLNDRVRALEERAN